MALALESALRASTGLEIWAQNAHFEAQGAFTGELSPKVLKDMGVRGSLIGHSERRSLFSESETLLKKRLEGALKFGLEVIYCIGENQAERESGKTFEILEQQLRNICSLADSELKPVTLAYEPVWAIGTGLTATPEQAQEVHAWIRGHLISKGLKAAESLRILYGGSVKPGNIEALLEQPDIGGALVGGASLKVEDFAALVQVAQKKLR